MQIVGLKGGTMRLILLFSAALAGCAAGVPAEQVSNVDLCRYTLYGTSGEKVTAEREARRRGLDCTPLYPAIVQQRAGQDAAMNNALQYFNRPAPVLNRPLSCTSYRLGHRTEVECQ
jgi:hypothetical protein